MDPSDSIEFHKIRYNSTEFRLEEVLYRKNPKNQKISRIYRLIGSNWPKFGEILEVIEVLKKLNFNYANIRNLK
jgi:hypothetical protein